MVQLVRAIRYLAQDSLRSTTRDTCRQQAGELGQHEGGQEPGLADSPEGVRGDRMVRLRRIECRLESARIENDHRSPNPARYASTRSARSD